MHGNFDYEAYFFAKETEHLFDIHDTRAYINPKPGVKYGEIVEDDNVAQKRGKPSDDEHLINVREGGEYTASAKTRNKLSV